MFVFHPNDCAITVGCACRLVSTTTHRARRHNLRHYRLIASRQCSFRHASPAPRSSRPEDRASSQDLRDADLECL